MKYFRILYYFLFAIIFVFGGLLVLSSFKIPGNVLFFVVESGSMEPAIRTGSLVMDLPSKDYAVNDVITFGLPGQKLTTHRIHEIRLQNGKPVYITKGDANNEVDHREVTGPEIIGKVRLSLPFMGYAMARAKTRAGFWVLIIVPAVIIVADELRKIFMEIRKPRKQETTPPEQL